MKTQTLVIIGVVVVMLGILAFAIIYYNTWSGAPHPTPGRSYLSYPPPIDICYCDPVSCQPSYGCPSNYECICGKGRSTLVKVETEM
jgi:hypothetical protein